MSTLLEPIRRTGQALMHGLFLPTSSPMIRDMTTKIFPASGAGNPPYRGEQNALEAYNAMPWLRAIASKIGDSMASLEWQLFYIKGKQDPKARKAGDIQRASTFRRKALMHERRENDELIEVTQHVLLDALDGGNGYFTGRKTRKLIQVFLELTGEAFIIKERNGMGAPVAFWPIPPSWVMSTATPTTPFYRISFRGFQTDIPDTEIYWISEPNPANPFGRGSGMTQAVSDELDTDEYVQKFLKQFFFNSARPDLIVSPDGEETISEPEAIRFERSWMDRHQGLWRPFRPFFSRRKIKVTPLQHNFQHLQLIDLRKSTRDTILQTWGFPPEIFGIIENSNRATIDSADYLYNSQIIIPRAEDFRAYLQQRVTVEYDPRLIVDYVSPIREDKEFALKAMQAAPWAYTADEWRSLAGQDKVDDDKGKIYAVPIGLTLEEEFAPGSRSITDSRDSLIGGRPLHSDKPAVQPKPLKAMSDQELLRLHAELNSQSS